MVWRGILIAIVSAAAMWAAHPIDHRNAIFRSAVTQEDDQDTIWQTEYGSYARTFSHRRVVKVSLHVVGETERAFEARWYFFGKDKAGAGALRIWGAGHARGALDGNNSANFTLASPWADGAEANYASLQEHHRRGLKPFGWGLVICQDGTAEAATGSTPENAALAKTLATLDPEKVKPDALVRDLITTP